MSEAGSERELEEFLAGALSFKNEEAEPETEPEEVVHDERPGFEPPPEDDAPTPPPSPAADVKEEAVGEEKPEEEAEEQDEPHVAWATKKYGTDPTRWAKAAYDQERFISQLAADKKQAEETAREAIAYAQQVEASASTSTGMPLSAAEEEWVDQAVMTNPAAYAYQAARGGNVQLYNAVIERVAMDNPGHAASIGTSVQMALHE